MRSDLPMPGPRPVTSEVETSELAVEVAPRTRRASWGPRMQSAVLAAGRERLSAAALALASVVALVWASSP
ncbi:MAG: hypothetical protein KJ792_12445, partial [Actinobacteria bacterium]|nr:hypothetical protein [Actinomycetota bacterium]MCG2800818.1 hypothetical protein [Cellulomonas sp.]